MMSPKTSLLLLIVHCFVVVFTYLLKYVGSVIEIVCLQP